MSAPDVDVDMNHASAPHVGQHSEHVVSPQNMASRQLVLRPEQQQVVHALDSGKSVAVFEPTSWGKSTIVHKMAESLHNNARNVLFVIVPLQCMMISNVTRLNTVFGGTGACFLGHAQLDDAVQSRALRGDYRVVYLTPEKFMTSGFADAVQSMSSRVRAFVLDEIHLVYDDFRQAYVACFETLVRDFQGVPLLLLSGSATLDIQQRLMDRLSATRTDPLQLVGSPYRDIAIRVYERGTVDFMTLILPHGTSALPDRTIVFVRTPAKATTLRDKINSCFDSEAVACAYHGQLSPEDKASTLHAFEEGQIRVFIATSSANHGLDVPSVKNLVILDAPLSPVALVQAIGRSGRGCTGATCTIVYGLSCFGFDHSTKEPMARTTAENDLRTVQKLLTQKNLCLPLCSRKWDWLPFAAATLKSPPLRWPPFV
jgi:superfamily II DNA helicase RecQ